MVVTETGERKGEHAPTVESSAIQLNQRQAAQLASLAEKLAALNGERVDDVRRGLELAVVSRGIDAIGVELRERERFARDGTGR